MRDKMAISADILKIVQKDPRKGFLITKELIFWLPNSRFFFTFQPP